MFGNCTPIFFITVVSLPHHPRIKKPKQTNIKKKKVSTHPNSTFPFVYPNVLVAVFILQIHFFFLPIKTYLSIRNIYETCKITQAWFPPMRNLRYGSRDKRQRGAPRAALPWDQCSSAYEIWSGKRQRGAESLPEVSGRGVKDCWGRSSRTFLGHRMWELYKEGASDLSL